METLYCLSMHKHGEYKEHSVYTSFENALVSVYDIALAKFSKILEEEGPAKAKKYIEDLKDINSIRKGYEPDKVTYLFDKRFRITRVQSMLTSKTALENIVAHVNGCFEKLIHMHTSKRICFPLEIMDERIKSAWYLLDEFNAEKVIQHLEAHVQRRIDELKLMNKEVVQGILERNNEDFVAVRFTDSQERILNKDIFAIVLSPNTGYDKSL
jgi:hypothetical protein